MITWEMFVDAIRDLHDDDVIVMVGHRTVHILH